MKKASTTNKNIIIFGSLLVIAIAVSIAIVSNNDAPNYSQVNSSFIPIEGAIANTYEAPTEILDMKDYDTIIGDKKAGVKVLVYEDYSSSYSAELAETLSQLMAEYDDDLAVITRPFVLSSSNESQQSALSYLCAQELDKGEEMRNLLLQQSGEEAISYDYLTYANELEINEESFLSCLTNEEKLVKLEELKKEAKDSLVLGAPTILVGNEMLVGARPYADFIDSNGDAIEGLKTVIERHMENKS